MANNTPRELTTAELDAESALALVRILSYSNDPKSPHYRWASEWVKEHQHALTVRIPQG